MFLRVIVGQVAAPLLAAIDFLLIRRRSLADPNKHGPPCALPPLRQEVLGSARAQRQGSDPVRSPSRQPVCKPGCFLSGTG